MNSEISIIVIPVFLVIALGFGLKRTGLVNSGFIYDLNRLVYYIALPALLFYKIGSADFSASFNASLLLTLAISIIAVFFISYGYAVIRKYPPEVVGAFCQGAFRGNLAYIGLAIVYSAYGESGFTTAGILLGFIVPLLNVLSVFALILPHGSEGSNVGSRIWVQQIASNPLIIASFAGIAWSYLQLPFPLIIDRALAIITGMSLPLALLSIGASFSLKKLRGDLGLALVSSLMKVVLLPIVAAVLMVFVGIQGQDLAIGVILAGAPTAAAAFIMSQQLRGDAELAGTIIMLSTVLSLITYTIALYFLHAA